MPAWLLSIVINMVIKYGAPWLISLLMKANFPKEIKDILQKLLTSLGDPKASDSSAKKTAIAELKTCLGVACEAVLKE